MKSILAILSVTLVGGVGTTPTDPSITSTSKCIIQNTSTAHDPNSGTTSTASEYNYAIDVTTDPANPVVIVTGYKGLTKVVNAGDVSTVDVFIVG